MISILRFVFLATSPKIVPFTCFLLHSHIIQFGCLISLECHGCGSHYILLSGLPKGALPKNWNWYASEPTGSSWLSDQNCQEKIQPSLGMIWWLKERKCTPCLGMIWWLKAIEQRRSWLCTACWLALWQHCWCAVSEHVALKSRSVLAKFWCWRLTHSKWLGTSKGCALIIRFRGLISFILTSTSLIPQKPFCSNIAIISWFPLAAFPTSAMVLHIPHQVFFLMVPPLNTLQAGRRASSDTTLVW